MIGKSVVFFCIFTFFFFFFFFNSPFFLDATEGQGLACGHGVWWRDAL